MKTTSPEVTGPVAVGLDGKVRLTAGQLAELAARRVAPAGFTAGEWNITKHGTPDYAPQYGIYAGDGSQPDFAIITGENAEANAMLIKASPRLLAALLEAQRLLFNVGWPAGSGNAREAVRQAIADATGEGA